MTPTDRLATFGSDEELPAVRSFHAGRLALEVCEGAVRPLRWDGVEVLRSVEAIVRDTNWGTYPQRTLSVDAEETSDAIRYRRIFDVADGLMSGELEISGAADGCVKLGLRLRVNRSVSINRAGFVLLHPAAAAGSRLAVTHSDGVEDKDKLFPVNISPSQVLTDARAISQEFDGVTAGIHFSGDVFEMEDQRNWTDASFKTYSRPLSLPTPYPVEAGRLIEQTIEIRLTGSANVNVAASAMAGLNVGRPTGRVVPEIALAIEPGWAPLGPVPKAPATQLRIDLTRSSWRDELAELLPLVGGALDLEVIIPDERGGTAAALEALAAALPREPRTIVALPRAYLKSYQPDGAWPSGATPEAAVTAAHRYFPKTRVGGGMLTNFTELNRYRGSAAVGDFVTHGTTALVHAADDLSVVQTLEALPVIFASTEAFAAGKPYRLGLCSIGMRSNPYGADMAANAVGGRVAMAAADPRQRGLFAAAFMVGVLAATERSTVESLALAAMGGPVGLGDAAGAYPAWHAFSALSRLSGRDRLAVTVPAGLAAVAAMGEGGTLIALANLTGERREVALPEIASAALLDRPQPDLDWLPIVRPERTNTIDLAPYALALLATGDSFGQWRP